METLTVHGWWVLPILIFLARIVDVTLGTLRVVFISRGLRLMAPLAGFFEVLIWITAITQIMRNLDNWVCYFTYAGGYAAGTYIGLWLEERLAMGTVVVRVIPQKRDATQLIKRMREENYGVTSCNAEGAKGPVKIVFSIIKRSALPKVLKMVKECNPNAFYTIEDVRSIHKGVFPSIPPAQQQHARPGK